MINDQIMSRIQEIQARIDSITGSAQAAPSVVPAAPSNGGSFANALQNAGAPMAPPLPQPEIGPDGTPVRPLGTVSGVASYATEISQAAAKYNIDPKVVQAVMQAESGGNPNAVSHAGAQGLMQLMPSNSAAAGVTDPFDPAQNIDAGTRQLASLISEFGGNLDLALAGYNAGPNAVKRFGGIPPYPETQNYVRKIRTLLGRS